MTEKEQTHDDDWIHFHVTYSNPRDNVVEQKFQIIAIHSESDPMTLDNLYSEGIYIRPATPKEVKVANNEGELILIPASMLGKMELRDNLRASRTK